MKAIKGRCTVTVNALRHPSGVATNGATSRSSAEANAREAAGVPISRANPNYCVATLLDRAAPSSRSTAARQPVLSSALRLSMQALVLGMFGISELHRRNASPWHADRDSALKAKLEVEASAEKEVAKASTKTAWRIVLVKAAVIFGSIGLPRGCGVLLMSISAASSRSGL
jgi:hypothetical protein